MLFYGTPDGIMYRREYPPLNDDVVVEKDDVIVEKDDVIL